MGRLEVSLPGSCCPSFRSSCLWTILCLAVLVPVQAAAADGSADPIISDGQAGARVWMRSHRIRVHSHGALVSVQEEIRLQGGWGAKEYRYSLVLPRGAVVTGFKVEREGRWSSGRMLDARYAGREYADLAGLPHRPDPGLIQALGGDRYLVRVWPVRSGGLVLVLVSWVTAVQVREGRRFLWLPPSPRDHHLVDAQVLVTGGTGSWKTQRLGRVLSLDLGPATGKAPLAAFVGHAAQGMPGCGPQSSGALILSLAGLQSRPQSAGIRLVVLVDRSRSMWPGSAKHAAALLAELVSRLHAGDRFALLAFDRDSESFGTGWQRPRRARVRAAGRWLARVGGGNGTDLTKALLQAHRLFGALPTRWKGRRVLVLLTDGLLPESFVAGPAARFLDGVELVALVGAAGSGEGMALERGPVAGLVRLRGGIGWAFDPAVFLRRCQSCPLDRIAKAILGAEPVTGVTARLDGRILADVPSSLTTVTGARAVSWWPGPAKALHIRFSHRGAWHSRSVRVVELHGSAGRALMALAASRAVAGFLAHRPKSQAERAALLHRTLRCAKKAGIVTPISSLVALDMHEPFSRDRWRFASRWGDRFFARIGTGGRSLSVPSIWGNPSHERVSVALSGGSLTRKMVLRRIRRGFIRKARRCYESVLDAGARPDVTLQGRIVLRLEVTRGEVVDVHIERPEFAHRKLFACLTEAAFSLRIPYSRADRTLYQVLYPMKFRLDDRSVQVLRNAQYVPRQIRSGDPLEDMD